MVLRLAFASEDDAYRIADIHMSAFATNENLLAQFPTLSVREGLRTTVAHKALEDIRDPNMAVLIIQDTELDNTIISFAKWNLPSSTDENEAPWVWPEGARIDLLDAWTEKVEETKSHVVGEQHCYRMVSLFT